MQFGKVLNPESINFFLPEDNPITSKNLNKNNDELLKIRVGCAKWNRQDLKNFYPKGIKDELNYYSTQFNAIELNATFYKMYPKEQFKKWKNKTHPDFKFFPKLVKQISHEYELNNSAIELAKRNIEHILGLEYKLGMIFLQMHENSSPSSFNKLCVFVDKWPKGVPLAIELRHKDWFNTKVSTELYSLFESYNVTNIITDTAGRRDLLHMALTTNNAFIRFVGANHSSDYTRLNQWLERITFWKKTGLRNLFFFVHQNIEIESVKLSAYFIKELNNRINTNQKVPTILDKGNQLQLF